MSDLPAVLTNSSSNSTHNVERYAANELEDVVAKRDVNSGQYGGKEWQPSQSKYPATSIPASGIAATMDTVKHKTDHPRLGRLGILPARKSLPIPRQRDVSHERGASLLSKLTFHWMAPLMRTGYRRPLELVDIWKINPDRGVETLKAQLNESLDTRIHNGSRRPLAMALYDTFRFELLVGAMCQLISCILQAVLPLSIRYLIAFANDSWTAHRKGYPAPPLGKGVAWVIGITTIQLLQLLCTNHFIYNGMMVGGQARGVLIALIFDKTIKLSGRAKVGGAGTKNTTVPIQPDGIEPGSESEKKWYRNVLRGEKISNVKVRRTDAQTTAWSNGRIINLMSTDTARVDTASGLFHMIWSAPITITLTLVFLLINITYSALPGFGLLVLSTLSLTQIIKRLMSRRVAINKLTDQRVTLTQEVLNTISFVKCFALELDILQRVQTIRKAEIREIRALQGMRNAILSLGMVLPVFASMLAFITYSLSGHALDPAPIFSSLALFNGLRATLTFFPIVLGQVIDAVAALNRIQQFLTAEEMKEDSVWKDNSDKAIEVKNANFTWETGISVAHNDKRSAEEHNFRIKQQDKQKVASNAANADMHEGSPFCLQSIDVSVAHNELIGIIGATGCGKTSLLAALAGEMRRTSGEVTFGASRAYCPQNAWVQNATVRENIVFGGPFDQKWYDQVVDACCLRLDIEMLPDGDQTEIGEKGITMSGGQRQRLNLARAIYFNAQLILMDDPLSAVDAHVGQHIMNNAICGLMRNKTRLIATHQLQFLARCDRIILMKEGRISSQGTFDDLIANDKAFQHLIAGTTGETGPLETAEAISPSDGADNSSKERQIPADLMQKEDRAVNNVDWRVYVAYLTASGSYLVAPLIFVLIVLYSAATVLTSLWLSWWSADSFHYSRNVYIGIYAALGLFQGLSTFAFSVALSFCCTGAGNHMLKFAMYSVLRAPLAFFDTIPLGRIMNRFSKDIDTMDNVLNDSWRTLLMTISTVTSVFILIIAYFYWFAIALVPLSILFFSASAYYRASAREIKRHEAVLRSHVFSRFGEAVTGTATIRAYGVQDQFMQSAAKAIDDMNSAYFLTFANQRWLAVRLDCIGILLTFIIGILVVTSRLGVTPSISGLVLAYILGVVSAITITVRQLADVENNMNSVERLYHYCKQVQQEAPLQIGQLAASWPVRGEIIFDKAQMRYRPGLPLVIRNLSLHIKPGEKIGIVGRTGAGKSSIVSIVYRLVELSGGIVTIDDIDISKIGLHDLRGRLSIIPQDPTLMRGTIRSNLDPFSRYPDSELWTALQGSFLVANNQASVSVRSGENIDVSDRQSPEHGDNTHIQLDTLVEEEGSNFSLGQRQLIALARALVRKSRIIICDEATSSIDALTDARIQETIASSFRDSTVLCIAHRLKTVIGYNRICVMDAGQIAELGTPLDLWDVNGGIFRGMCESSGISRASIAAAQGQSVQ